MKSIKKKIVITGGEGRFAKSLKNSNLGLNIFYPNKKELNILNTKSIDKYLKKLSQNMYFMPLVYQANEHT